MRIGIKSKLINHNLHEAIKSLGFDNVSSFCKDHGFHATLIGKFLNLKAVPKKPEFCKRLEKVLKRPIDYLFPADMVEAVAKKPKTVFYFSKELDYIPIQSVDPKLLGYEIDLQSELKNEEKEEAIKDTLKTLTEREERVLRMRFGFDGDEPKTFKEIGKKMGFNTERARQITAKALRKMKHPKRSEKLKEFLNED